MFETIFVWIKEYGTLLLELIKRYGFKMVLTLLMVVGLLFGIGYIVEYKINKIIPQTFEQSIDDNYYIFYTATEDLEGVTFTLSANL